MSEFRPSTPLRQYAAVGTVAAALGLGIGFNGSELNDTRPAATERSIEKGLNSEDQIARDVVVMVGYELPYYDESIGRTMLVRNPIKFDANTYGYFRPIPESGVVDVVKIDSDNTLALREVLGHTKLYPHEVMTNVSKVFNEYVTPMGDTDRVTWVVMGDHPGDADDLLDAYPAPKGGSELVYENNLLFELSSAGVGQIVGDGK